MKFFFLYYADGQFDKGYVQWNNLPFAVSDNALIVAKLTKAILLSRTSKLCTSLPRQMALQKISNAKYNFSMAKTSYLSVSDQRQTNATTK